MIKTINSTSPVSPLFPVQFIRRHPYVSALVAITTLATAVALYTAKTQPQQDSEADKHLIQFFRYVNLYNNPTVQYEGAHALRSYLETGDDREILSYTDLEIDRSRFTIDPPRPLDQLPPEIGLFGNLRALGAWNQRLHTLPITFQNLTNLTWLSLHYNEFETIPHVIGSLTNLISLNFEGNQLRSVSNTLQRLPNLRHLNLQDNKLKDLPDFILNLADTCRVHVNGNPFTRSALGKIPPHLRLRT